MLNARLARTRLEAGLLALVLIVSPAVSVRQALAASAAEINRDANAELAKLYQKYPRAKQMAAQAKAILVFPSIYKAGFMFGAQYGEGVLRKGNKSVGYYNTVAASYGWQAGAQAFGYALFFMNDGALSYLDKSGGFDVGVGPSIVIMDEGAGKSTTSSTLTQDIYAFIFDQKGLMAGAGLQGSKISRIEK
jgi:lipid-binding SYLF domain-containing protein